jgi:hypothetical protein
MQMPTKITFLLGAGASVPAGIPHVRRFFTDFSDDFIGRLGAGHELAQALEAIVKAWESSSDMPPLGDLERLYEVLTFINHVEAPRSIPLALPDAFPKRSRETELLEWELKKYVQQRCLAVPYKNVRYLRPITRFLELSRPLAIISLNYDACMEIVLERGKVPWSDGGPPGEEEFFASHLDFSRAAQGVQLIKLHGSATWYQTRLETEPGWMRRVRASGQEGVSNRLRAARTMTHEAMMIYPTLNKALTNGPFPSLAVRAQEALAESRLCLAVGYSFGDVHVRELVLEAMTGNPDLHLVLVDPKPGPILQTLRREAGAMRSDRITVASSEEEFGRIETALKDDWLFHRCEAWLRGEFRDFPVAYPSTIVSPSPWRIRYPMKEKMGGLARSGDKIYVALPKRNEVVELDMKTGNLRSLVRNLLSLHGLAFDPATQALYAVSNRYRSLLPKAPWSRGGIGQLWAVNVENGSKRSLTRIRLIRTGLRMAKNRWRGIRKMSWKQLVGSLRWPTSVIVEEPGRTVLLTEAKAIRRMDVLSKALSNPVELPLPFNVVGLAMEAPGVLLVADAGVHPNGFGRLMRVCLHDQSVEVLAGGWPNIGSMAFLPSRGLALLVQGGPRSKSRIFALSVQEPTKPSAYSWEGLHHPSHICLNADESEVLVSTQEGIVELTLA